MDAVAHGLRHGHGVGHHDPHDLPLRLHWIEIEDRIHLSPYHRQIVIIKTYREGLVPHP